MAVYKAVKSSSRGEAATVSLDQTKKIEKAQTSKVGVAQIIIFSPSNSYAATG
jgi:hypothetical protein